MKKFLCLILALLTVMLAACAPQNPEGSSEPASSETGEKILTGWHTIDGNRYCFGQDGTPLNGWINDGTSRFYFDASGMALTGWQELEGKKYYFDDNGAMTVGWAYLGGNTYYFGVDGSLFTGLLNIGGKGYYFTDSGRMFTGWLETSGKTYYFDENGVMAVGQVEIDGQIHHFSPRGVKVLLVNPWNFMPEDYEVELLNMDANNRMAEVCADALKEMLDACGRAGHRVMMVSAYRTQEEQEYLFNRKVNAYLSLGWDYDTAVTEAAKEVARPGTSEHQLGLAVDLMDISYPYLDAYQANTEAQKWLMEHCYEYGFILRYPVDTTAITGIIYEPWHYRYVGVEIAQEIMNLGITLEEYLGAA